MFVREDITFDDIMALYEFDRDLRALVFTAIARIEVSVRARITQIYSESTDDIHWFLDESLYRCNFSNLVDDIESEVDRSNEEFI